MEKFDVICIGTAIMDTVIKGFDPQPVSKTGYRAASASLQVGGDAVNEAVASAKLGMRTAILTALGKDPAGEIILRNLQKHGVNTDHIVLSAGHPTPITTIFLNPDGTRRSITNEAHRHSIHPEDHLELLPGTRAVILGSLFRVPFDDPQVISRVVRTAKAAGALVLADTKLPNFRRLSLDDLSDALPFIDYITPNEDEARYYTSEKNVQEMAEVFLERGVQNVIIKQGARGCFFRNKAFSLQLPAFPVDAADCTGAGDHFMTGFLSEILRGVGIPDALRFANACGAVCTTAVGAGTALKNREQVLQFMD